MRQRALRLASSALCLLAVSAPSASAQRPVELTECTNAELRAAIAAGGDYVYACTGATADGDEFPLRFKKFIYFGGAEEEIVVDKNVTIDGSGLGYEVWLLRTGLAFDDPYVAPRMFRVARGATLTLKGLFIHGGKGSVVFGEDSAGPKPAAREGGCMYVSAGARVELEGTTFMQCWLYGVFAGGGESGDEGVDGQNGLAGEPGSDSPPGSAGGDGLGGSGGSSGGKASGGGAGTEGGDAFGGAIYNAGTLVLKNATFEDNKAEGGAGGSGGNGASGGSGGYGGGGGKGGDSGVDPGTGTCCSGGGRGGDGGRGSAAGQGGSGSSAGTAKPGGDAFGGAIYNVGLLTAKGTTFRANVAEGGEGGIGGGGGDGGPGGSAGGGGQGGRPGCEVESDCPQLRGGSGADGTNGDGGNGGSGGNGERGGNGNGSAIYSAAPVAVDEEGVELVDNVAKPGVGGPGGRAGLGGSGGGCCTEPPHGLDGLNGSEGSKGQDGGASEPGLAFVRLKPHFSWKDASCDCSDEQNYALDGSRSFATSGVAAWKWTFDDGTTDRGAKVSYSPPDRKPHKVTLEITDGLGFTEAVSANVKPCVGETGAGARRGGARTTATPAQCFKLGIGWEMEERTPDVPRLAGQTSLGMLRTSDIYKQLTVLLHLAAGGNRVENCNTDSVWKWKVKSKPDGAKVVHEPKPGCKSFMQVTKNGAYGVEAQRFVKGKLKGTLKKKIQVQDLLVIGMGDSNGSGEGYPPFWFEQCNRGSASYQYQTSKLLEQQSSKHSSVTFVSASCSGARTDHLGENRYTGINPAAPLTPQIPQLVRHLAPPSGKKRRKPDAALVSIGVNDLAFGPLLAYCIEYAVDALPGTPASCEDSTVNTTKDRSGRVTAFQYDPGKTRTLEDELNTLVQKLPAHYNEVAAALSAGGLVKSNRVYLTQYPSFFFDSRGSPCRGAGTPLTDGAWKFLARQGSKLNNAVLTAAARHGWKAVTVTRQPFFGHGYCSSDPWFVSLTSALSHGNKAGAFHPTERGAHVTAVATLQRTCGLLALTKACKDFPVP